MLLIIRQPLVGQMLNYSTFDFPFKILYTECRKGGYEMENNTKKQEKIKSLIIGSILGIISFMGIISINWFLNHNFFVPLAIFSGDWTWLEGSVGLQILWVGIVLICISPIIGGIAGALGGYAGVILRHKIDSEINPWIPRIIGGVCGGIFAYLILGMISYF